MMASWFLDYIILGMFASQDEACKHSLSKETVAGLISILYFGKRIMEFLNEKYTDCDLPF